MLTIPRILRSLGNDGAVRNARAQLDREAREAWLVASLALRLDQADSATVTATAAVTASAA